MKLSLANKVFGSFALIDAAFFGSSIAHGHPGLAIVEAFVAIFCALGAVADWNKA